MANDDSQLFTTLGQLQARLQQQTAECRAEQRQTESNFREIGTTTNRHQVEFALLKQRVDRLEIDLSQGLNSVREQAKASAAAPAPFPAGRQIAMAVACAIAISLASSLLTVTYDKPDNRLAAPISATK
jgi:uncharacterized protein YukE